MINVRDLVRQRGVRLEAGQFLFLIRWSDLRGQLDSRVIAIPSTLAQLTESARVFQQALEAKYARDGHNTILSKFISNQTTNLARQAVVFLAKDHPNIGQETETGLLALTLSSWLAMRTFERKPKIDFNTLKTVAVYLNFHGSGFTPVIMTDQGADDSPPPKGTTIH